MRHERGLRLCASLTCYPVKGVEQSVRSQYSGVMSKDGELGGLRAGILGEVEVRIVDTLIALGHTRQRSVLAALLVDADRLVPIDDLVDRVWGNRAPRRVRSVVRTYLSRLRQALAATGVIITGENAGYRLRIDRDVVDLHRFHRYLNLSKDEQDPRKALSAIDNALALWRGDPLSGMDTPWARSVRDDVSRRRMAAQADRVDLALRCGGHHELVPELTARAAADPFDERVAGQLLVALYRSGHQAGALHHYRETRRRLAEELGVDPTPALRRLHDRVLAADPTLAAVAPATPAVPRQLPAAPRWFAGRAEHIAILTATVDALPAVWTLIGPGGIGKTWLALHWAYHHLNKFPDGQLFLDLRGFSPTDTPLDPLVAIHGFLHALGVEPADVPSDATSLFRSVTVDKRVLIVLDNARDAAQVIPLLPGGRCTVLVTSRNEMTELVAAHGAETIRLGALASDEAHTLLGDLMGDVPEVADLASLCGGYPLALAVVAARARTHRARPVDLVAELREVGVAALEEGTSVVSLPRLLSQSYELLDPMARRLFVLLGHAPGPDIGPAAAAGLADQPVLEIRRLLRELMRASLLDHDHGRYRMHDLIRQYAITLPLAEVETAVRRAVDHYSHTAYLASRLVHPHARAVPPRRGESGSAPEHLVSPEQAWEWFHRERECALAAQRAAVEKGQYRTAWLLTCSLMPFYYLTADFHGYLNVCRTGLSAAIHLDDSVVLSDAHRFLGDTLCWLDHSDEGFDHLRTALTLAESIDDPRCLTRTYEAMAWSWSRQAQHKKALVCAHRALDFGARLDNPVWDTVVARSIAARSAIHLGDIDLAVAHCRIALPVQREHHDRDGEANSLFTLGLIALKTGDTRRASTRFQEALAMFREQRNTHLQADTLDLLGYALRLLGEHERAEEHRRAALDLYTAQHRHPPSARIVDLGTAVAAEDPDSADGVRATVDRCDGQTTPIHDNDAGSRQSESSHRMRDVRVTRATGTGDPDKNQQGRATFPQ